MNAVERLWRALAAGDWTALRAQLGRGAAIDRPGDRLLAADAYVAALCTAGAPVSVEVRRLTGDGTIVAVEAAIVRADGRFRVVAVYDLHDGLIAGGTEAWVREAG